MTTIDEAEQIIRGAIQTTRIETLEAAIEICEEVMKTGGGAAQCVVSLRRLRVALPADLHLITGGKK
jgi:hypothetical protein